MTQPQAFGDTPLPARAAAIASRRHGGSGTLDGALKRATTKMCRALGERLSLCNQAIDDPDAVDDNGRP